MFNPKMNLKVKPCGILIKLLTLRVHELISAYRVNIYIELEFTFWMNKLEHLFPYLRRFILTIPLNCMIGQGKEEKY